MGDALKVNRWSFHIDAVARALHQSGLAVTALPAGLTDRRAVFEASGEDCLVTVTLRDERTGPPSVEVTCRVVGVPVELTLRPELVGEGIDKLMGMTVDQLVGDADFDRDFVIASAPRSIAASLLTTTVREQLTALPRSSEGPSLTMKDGAITLRWWAEPLVDHVVAGLSVVSTLREVHRQMVEGDGAFGGGPFRQGAAGDRAVDPTARATAWQRFAAARRRTAAVLTAATVAGVGFLAAVITHHP